MMRVCLTGAELRLMANRAAALEAEVAELRNLRDLVTEASRVTFANDLPHEYPLSVWEPGHEDKHAMTWGATLAAMSERGGRVRPEMIAHALKRMRECREGGEQT
jgi:hypothetical protein